MVARAAALHDGPQLLHVGERSPKDKNFETSEVVLAAPGTVVAPIPKGMKPTEENAIALVMSQLLKTMGKPKGAKSKGVQGAQLGFAGSDDYIPPGTLFYSPPPPVGPSRTPDFTGSSVGFSAGPVGASTAAPTVSTPRYSAPVSGGGTTSNFFDPGVLYSAGNTLTGNAANYNLGRRGLSQADQHFQQNFGLGQQRFGLEQGQFGLAQQRFGLDQMLANAQVQQFQEQMALDQAMLDLQEMIAQQQYQLGVKALALQELERQDALNLGTRSLDIQAMDDEFDRIMRGVSEASVSGVRSGRPPSTGLFT